MTRSSRRALLCASSALALSTLILPAAPAGAQEVRTGDISITQAWSRAAGRGATGAGFMTLRNAGRTPDRLVSAATPAARTVELHTHIRDGDVMRMRPVEAIEIPAGQEVRLAPGGLHLMLIGLARPLNQGERVPVTLTFARSGSVQVELEVQSAGARGPGGGHGH